MESGNDAHRVDTRTKTEQIVRELYVKLTQVILQSRIPMVQQAAKNGTGKVKINKWFNLELEEVENITQELTPWRQNMYIPLCIKVFFNSSRGMAQHPYEERVMLEKWKIQLEPHTGQRENVEVPVLYKRLVLLVRSLYSYLRVVPTYSVFRDCHRNKLASPKMFYQLDRSDTTPATNRFGLTGEPNGIPGFSEFRFDVINTILGKLSIVAHTSDDCSFQRLVSSDESVIPSQTIISDYQPSSVGSADSGSQQLQIALLQQHLIQQQQILAQQKQIMQHLQNQPLSSTPPAFYSTSAPNAPVQYPLGVTPPSHQSASPTSHGSTPRSFTQAINLPSRDSTSFNTHPTLSSTPMSIPNSYNVNNILYQHKTGPSPSSISDTSPSSKSFQVGPIVSPPFYTAPISFGNPSTREFSTTPPLQPLQMSTSFSSVRNSTSRSKTNKGGGSSGSADSGGWGQPQLQRANSNLPFFPLSDLPMDSKNFSASEDRNTTQDETPSFLLTLGSLKEQDTEDIGYFIRTCQSPPTLMQFRDQTIIDPVGHYDDLLNQLLGFQESMNG